LIDDQSIGAVADVADVALAGGDGRYLDHASWKSAEAYPFGVCW
jgi:hypothetical protein